MGFVQSLVHPSAAQVMELIGDPKPRPAAPWGYTNTWGNNFCLLVVWFVALYWGGLRRAGGVLAAGCLVLAMVPVVYSLNRGLWIGLGVVGLLRRASGWRCAAASARSPAIAAAAVVLGAALAVTPLGDVVDARLYNGKSNGVRMYLTERAVTGFTESPLIGFGSTRSTMGGRNSIAVGASNDCERCGNFTIGGNGQLWQLMYAHGLLGTVVVSGLLPVRPLAVPARSQRDRHRRLGRDRGQPRRDVLVQRAGHAAGLDLLRVRPAVEERAT